MKNKVLLIGNDINNIRNANSWIDLLNKLKRSLDVDMDFSNDKPFPLAYEELFFKCKQHSSYKDLEIKRIVCDTVSEIEPNEIHEAILDLDIEHLLTTNYDHSFQKALKHQDHMSYTGIINETKYSLFRKYELMGKSIWHIHGDIKTSNSVTLGYEHYNGYIQHMRDYIVNGTDNSYRKFNFKPLISRLKTNPNPTDSWVDLFFTRDIFIIGLKLDFHEIDLWWLLTYRARFFEKHTKRDKGNIYYFIPQLFVASSKSKIDLLKSVGVTVIALENEKTEYYMNVIKHLRNYV